MNSQETTLGWDFIKLGPGTVPADSMANPLQDTQLMREEVLVREALQNSYDERVNGRKLSFCIRKHSLTGKKKDELAKLLQLKTVLDKQSKTTDSNDWLSKAQKCKEILDDPKARFNLLEISDYNANGLGGQWDKPGPGNRFFNLVLSLYYSDKQASEEDKALGSYGVGKMVFALCSDMRTMFYHSKFKCKESNKDNYRMMGTSFLPVYKDDDQDYTGLGYFGVKAESSYPRKPLERKNVSDVFRNVIPCDLRIGKGGGGKTMALAY